MTIPTPEPRLRSLAANARAARELVDVLRTATHLHHSEQQAYFVAVDRLLQAIEQEAEQPEKTSEERIDELARSFADTIGARAYEQQGGKFNYVVAAAVLRRLIKLVQRESE